MGEQPKLTKTEPWELIQQFIQAAQRTGEIDQRAANAMEGVPVEQMARERALRIAKQLGLEYLPQELDIRQPYEERETRRREESAIRIDRARTDNNVRQSQEAIDRDIERYRKDPEGYREYREAQSPYTYRPRSAGKEPFPDDLVAAPNDPVGDGAPRRMIEEQLAKEGIKVIGTEVRNGKLYLKLDKGRATPDPNPPPAQPEEGSTPPKEVPQLPVEKGSVTGKGDRAKGVVQPVPQKPSQAAPDMTDRVFPGGQKPAKIEVEEPEPENMRKSPLLDNPAAKQGSSLEGNKEDLIRGLYDSLTTVAGYSDVGAKAILAEIGRENDFKESLIFGSHSDPKNGARNVGFLSWQKDRGARLIRELDAQGLVHNGRIERSQEAMDAMARFMANEMEMTNNGLHNYLKSEDVDPYKAASALGRRFIRWRYNDPQYKEGHGRRDDWYEKANQVLERNAMAEEEPKPEVEPLDPRRKRKGLVAWPKVAATSDPDIFDVLLEGLG